MSKEKLKHSDDTIQGIITDIMGNCINQISWFSLLVQVALEQWDIEKAKQHCKKLEEAIESLVLKYKKELIDKLNEL